MTSRSKSTTFIPLDKSWVLFDVNTVGCDESNIKLSSSSSKEADFVGGGIGFAAVGVDFWGAFVESCSFCGEEYEIEACVPPEIIAK
jgi:hypothetical protein